MTLKTDVKFEEKLTCGLENDMWLATCARKLKVPGSSPAASYVQRCALCSNRPTNV